MKWFERWMAVVIAWTLAAFAAVVAAADYELVVMSPPGHEVRASHARDLDESGNVAGWFAEREPVGDVV